jgi:uncharacterized protein (DUF1330 family)
MPAYLIATMDVHDAGGYEAYRARVPAFVEKHGGRFIVRGGERTPLEGDWPPGRTVVIAFPDYDAAKAFVDDPGYAPVAAIRHATAISRAFIAEGLSDAPAGADFGGYLLATIRIEDPDAYKVYTVQVPPVMEQYAGTFLTRGGRAEGIEGSADPGRVVLVGFADVAAVRRFHGSKEYAGAAAIRRSASTGSVVALEAFRP